jgi:hypothetical protein
MPLVDICTKQLHKECILDTSYMCILELDFGTAARSAALAMFLILLAMLYLTDIHQAVVWPRATYSITIPPLLRSILQ